MSAAKGSVFLYAPAMSTSARYGTSLFTTLMSEPPKKLPKPTPKVVMARPVTF